MCYAMVTRSRVYLVIFMLTRAVVLRMMHSGKCSDILRPYFEVINTDIWSSKDLDCSVAHPPT